MQILNLNVYNTLLNLKQSDKASFSNMLREKALTAYSTSCKISITNGDKRYKLKELDVLLKENDFHICVRESYKSYKELPARYGIPSKERHLYSYKDIKTGKVVATDEDHNGFNWVTATSFFDSGEYTAKQIDIPLSGLEYRVRSRLRTGMFTIPKATYSKTI